MVQARPELLDRLELRRPCRHLLEVLRRSDRDAGLGGEGGDRVELVAGPLVRCVVVHVEEAEHLVAVEQRRGAHRVEALLHHGRADVGAARVVAIVGREQRTAGSDRVVREASCREIADGREVGGRQASTDLGDDPAVGLAQEHGGAVALEQHHRVADEAGQDPIEVQAAADVARHPPQRLGPVEQVGDLLLASDDADDGADRVGHDGGEVAVGRVEAFAGCRDDEHGAPRPVTAGDGRRQFLAIARQDRGGDAVAAAGDHGRRAGRRFRVARPAPGRELDGLTEHPEALREVEQSRRCDARRYGDRRRAPVARRVAPRSRRGLGHPPPACDRRRGRGPPGWSSGRTARGRWRPAAQGRVDGGTCRPSRGGRGPGERRRPDRCRRTAAPPGDAGATRRRSVRRPPGTAGGHSADSVDRPAG